MFAVFCVIILTGGVYMFANLICASIAALQMALSPAPLLNEIDMSYIIHAAGEIDGYTTTNSLEALEKSYADGNRLIEIDFNFTSNLYAVCVHDWNYAIMPGYDKEKAKRPTVKQYRETKIYGKFTPLELDSLVDYLASHEDLYIITDCKEYNMVLARKIKEEHPKFMDRFIMQVYSEKDYKEISAFGYNKIIFTLYDLDWKTKTDTEYLVNFAKEHPVFAYTFPHELCDIDGYVENMLKSGVPLFIHTVNDKELQQKYFDMGITGIYTDNTIHS